MESAETPWHIQVVDLEGTGTRTRTVSGRAGAPTTQALVRLHGRSLALVTGTEADLEEALRGAATGEANTERGWAQLPPGPTDGHVPTASVVICTTGRCDMLARAVQAVLAQDTPLLEVLVVDNDPASGATGRALREVDDPRLSIVAAPEPGLSRARNRGLVRARGQVIAFTDDDALVDPSWLRRLLEPFAADPQGRIGAVTGIVLAAQIAHPAQRWFESRGGFPKDLAPRVWTLKEADPALARMGEPGEGGPLHPHTTARVGAGVCMALRARALRQVGPFDVALGAGTPTRGGEDLDMFARILRAGWAIVHTPDALVHHRHRTDEDGLTLQIRGNGSGTAALLTKTVLADPRVLVDLARRVPAVARRLRPGSARVSGADQDVPAGLTRAEIAGFLEGPFVWARAKARAHAVRRARLRGRRQGGTR
ncbi:glycosyltransferase [Schaalia sp. 19OD2882]|uniref:glycosyltransferase family 2 protein n=1 Tax=Schaalia sp. 19OD2882 TaxID=2794089 RepID=UPI001C1F1DA6|nr:glycosyltransferase [Schaalia sp. 19OD2882]QWW19174.1 glycosyltransferase [Schaalia sp. 19OD2882]